MINRNEKQVALAFGTGDICVTGGYFNGLGIVTFSNQSPREINSIGDIKVGQGYNLDDFPVVMSFSKVESIDVVIAQLEQAKADMAIKCEIRKNGMCSTRDYGGNEYKNPCYKCCLGCDHAINMDCTFVCHTVAEHYYPEEE